MAAKRKPARPRTVPARHPTRSAELSANADDRYFVDQDGPKRPDGFYDAARLMYGIRDRETGGFDPRPTLTRSEVYDEVEQLNGRAEPWSNVTRGKLTGESRRVKDTAITLSDGLVMPSPIECVERIVYLRSIPATVTPEDVMAMLETVIERPVWRAFATSSPRRQRLHVNAIGRHIKRWYGARCVGFRHDDLAD